MNIVWLAPAHRPKLGRWAWQSIALAIAGAIVVAAIDQLFFDGATARRAPPLDAHPSPGARIVIPFVGGFLEEIVFRIGLATVVAAVVWTAVRRVLGEGPRSISIAQWSGTLAAALVVGLWHVWMVTDPASSDARVVAINLVGNVLYGWTYWRRGLEMATLTHGTLNSTLYLGLPLLH